MIIRSDYYSEYPPTQGRKREAEKPHSERKGATPDDARRIVSLEKTKIIALPAQDEDNHLTIGQTPTSANSSTHAGVMIPSKSVFAGKEKTEAIEFPKEIIDYFSTADSEFQDGLNRVLYETRFPKDLIINEGLEFEEADGGAKREGSYLLALPYEAASMSLSKLRPETLNLLSKSIKTNLSPDQARTLMQHTLEDFTVIREHQVLGKPDASYMTFEDSLSRETILKQEAAQAQRERLLHETGMLPDFLLKPIEEFRFTTNSVETSNINELSEKQILCLEDIYGSNVFIKDENGDFAFNLEHPKKDQAFKEVQDYLLIQMETKENPWLEALDDLRNSFSGSMLASEKQSIISKLGPDAFIDLGDGLFSFNPSNQTIQANLAKYDAHLSGLLIKILQARVSRELDQGGFPKILQESHKSHGTKENNRLLRYLVASLAAAGAIANSSFFPSIEEPERSIPVTNALASIDGFSDSVTTITPEPIVNLAAAELIQDTPLNTDEKLLEKNIKILLFKQLNIQPEIKISSEVIDFTKPGTFPNLSFANWPIAIVQKGDGTFHVRINGAMLDRRLAPPEVRPQVLQMLQMFLRHSGPETQQSDLPQFADSLINCFNEALVK